MATFYRIQEWIKSVTGQALPGVQVYICNQPATTTGNPPSPLATIYADSMGVTPLSQPLISDGFGFVFGYVAPGLYTVVVASGLPSQQVYEDQNIAEAGVLVGFPLLVTAPTPGQVLEWDGTEWVNASLPAGGPSIEINGTPAADQTELNFTDTATVTWTSGADGSVSANAVASALSTSGLFRKFRYWLPAPNNPGTGGSIGVGTSGATGGSGSFYAGSQYRPEQYSGDAGLYAKIDSGAGMGSQLAFGAISGGPAYALGSGANQFPQMFVLGQNFRYWRAKFRLDQLTTTRVWAGLTDLATIDVSFSFTALKNNSISTLGNSIMFMFSSGVSSSHWRAYSSDGAGESITDTGVAADTNQHVFEILANAAGTSVQFFIDGNLVATLSASLPTGAFMSDMISIDNVATTNSVTMGAAYVYIVENS